MNQAEIKRRQAEMLGAVLTFLTLAVVARVTGENGVTYIVAALEVYGLVWALVGGGVSATLGRLLRIRNAKGQYRNSLKLRKNVFLLQTVLGAAGSLLLLLLAEELTTELFGLQYSAIILRVLAPALFLRAVSDVLLGCLQGEGSELPTAVYAILKQLFILGFGLLFGRMLADYGAKVSRLLLQDNFKSMYGGIGIAIAISLTEGLMVIFLFLIYKGRKRPGAKLQEDGMRFTDSMSGSLRIFALNRAGQLGITLAAVLPFPAGLLLIQRTAADAGAAAVEYGAYLSGYLVLCGGVSSLIYLLGLPVAGRVFVCLRKDEQRYARVVFQSGIHSSIVHGGFATVFLTVLAAQAAHMVSAAAPEKVSEMLAGGASLCLFLPLTFYFGRVLLLSGRKGLLLGGLALADVVYVVSASVFLCAGKMGVPGLVYGGVLGAGTACLLLGFFSCRQLRLRFDWLQTLAIPAGTAAVTGLLLMFLAKLLTPHVGPAVTLAVLLAVGAAVYWILLFVLRNWKEQELEAIPGGRILNAIGQLLHCIG